LAPEMISVVIMVLGAGVLMGVLNGPVNAKGEYVSGMSHAIAVVLTQMIPSSLGKYFAIIIAFISAPGTYLLNNDAFYYGVLPPLAATAKAYGFSNLQIGFASLMGQAFHFLSPLVPFIYLLMDKTEITLGEYQSYIFRWCIGIFICFMAIGLILGYLPIL
ncbi:citrate transporter, partial [Lactobacillus mulieris]|nr:citrate transporter [Lactobacillus mulieris]MDK7348895.1 citrate transporter [Lactobacillus mulieris]